MLTKTDKRMGKSFPLGATVYSDGVNFSVFSKNATKIEMLLFDTVDDSRPAQVISLDRRFNRTFHFWHVYVPNLQPGQLYAYRAHGSFDPYEGLRFDPDKVLLDPYGKGVANLSIFPVQDILGLDRKSRTNVPGKATGNWQWRMEQKSLTKKLAMKLSTETQTFNRLP